MYARCDAGAHAWGGCLKNMGAGARERRPAQPARDFFRRNGVRDGAAVARLPYISLIFGPSRGKELAISGTIAIYMHENEITKSIYGF